jgi:radical SAM-linked protein
LASNNFTEQSNSPEKWTSKNHIKVSSTSQGTKGPQPLEQARYLARFAKQGPLIFIGHLEMVEVFKRAFRRSGFNLVMSQGFHPQPRLSFLTALPLGVASLDECLLFSLPWPPVNPQQIYQNLDLPSGLRLTGPPEHLSNQKKVCAAAASWEIVSSEPVFQTPPLHLGAHLSYTDTKGVLKNFDLGHFVAQASAVNSYTAHLTIRQSDRGTPKPLAVASKLWGLETNFPAKIIKLATILNN